MSKEIRERLRWLISHMNDKYMDGFNQFGAKKELYEIKWMVDEALKDAPTFTIEKEWLEKRIDTMTLL